MIEIYSLIAGVLLGVATSAYFIMQPGVPNSRKIFEHTIPLLLVIMFSFISVLFLKNIINEQELQIESLKNENINNLDVIAALKEKLLLNIQLSNLYHVVLDTNDMPAIPYGQGQENKIADRRIPTKDNAFYISFSNYFQIKNQGANFQINFPRESDDGEDKININVSRYSIKRLLVGNYVYNFSIPEPINPESEKISLRMTKESDVKKYINVLLSKVR